MLALIKSLTFYGLNVISADQVGPLKPSMVLIDSRTSDNATCNSDWNEGESRNPIETKKKRFTKKHNQGHKSSPNKSISLTDNSNGKNVPLIKYTENTSRIIKNAPATSTTSESEISDIDSSQADNSKFHIDKCKAKVRVAALSVLETAFEVIRIYFFYTI